ncbi:MAG: hypothetical protein ACSW75_02440, partial [Lachnospiraceae bacterium]
HSLVPKRTVMVGNDFSADMGIAALCGTDGIFLNTDGFSDEEISSRLAAMRAETGTRFSPRIIRDGDIGKILTDEE